MEKDGELPRLPFFFFHDTATTEIYTLSLHDALPIWDAPGGRRHRRLCGFPHAGSINALRSEEHTSELQSPMYLVCRLLLEKKKWERSCGIRSAPVGILDIIYPQIGRAVHHECLVRHR